MKVEIWSDILCPWCYIGKRQFELALAKFPQKDAVEVLWRSFELDPQAPKDPGMDSYGVLATKYGVSRERAADMHRNVSDRAAEVGLDYHLNISKPTNSFDAHRLIHFAASKGLQHEMVERLSAAYLTEGKNISDGETLVAMAVETGLDAAETWEVFANDQYAEAVRADEREAQQLGIRGVPFFVFERKYGASGAQGTEIFLQILEKAQAEAV